jgi:nicotinamidase-related amidase
MSSKVKVLPIPAGFDNVTKFETVYNPKLSVIEKTAEEWAKTHGVSNYIKDTYKICLMIIDAQNSFCLPEFELFVGGRSGRGAIDDNVRLAQFIYRNLSVLTNIAPTMDTHLFLQIFLPHCWVDDKGNHPVPNGTMLTYKSGSIVDQFTSTVYKANPAVAAALTNGNYSALSNHFNYYVKTMTENGKYALTVWDYHTMLGTIGHPLVAGLFEAIFFHAAARHAQYIPQIKGGSPYTENYSIFAPEILVGADGRPLPSVQKNTAFLEALYKFDAIVIAGQAKSHCVAWTIQHLLDEINAKDPTLAKKVYLLGDCTSPVVIPGVIDFTDQADAAFKRFADAGMNVVSSTDAIESWPGIRL